jgi:putative copper export protein
VWAEAHAADRRPHDETERVRPRGSRVREDLLGASEPIRGEHIPPGGRRPGGGPWQGLGGWQEGLDDSRLLRRMVVSPLDPPFSRTGEFEAVPTAGSGRLPPPPVEPPLGRAGRPTGPDRSVTAVPPLSPEEEARRAMRPSHARAPAAGFDVAGFDVAGADVAAVDVEDSAWHSGTHAQATVAPPHERDTEAGRSWRTVPPPSEPDTGDHDTWRTVPPRERDAEALRSWRTVPPPFEPDAEDPHGWRSGAPAFAPDVESRSRVPHARPTEVEPRRDLRPVPHGPAIPVRPPSRAAAVLGLLAAIGFAWLVLVTLRQPTVPVPPIGPAGARIDEAVAQTLYADRVLAVLDWTANVSTLLVLGGVIYRLFVAGPEPGKPGSKHAGPLNARSPQAAPGATSSSAGLRTLRQAAVAGVAAELGSMLVRAVAMSGSGLAAAWDPDMLGFVVAVPFGDAALVRIAGLLLLAALAVPVESPVRQAWAQRRNGHHPNGNGNGRGPAPRTASERLALEKFACLLGGLVVLASFVLVGHPQATERAPLLAFAQCIHVLAVSTWFGGVAFLSIELRQQRREGTARVFAGAIARFSTVAGATVVMAGATGLVLANSQLASPSALLDTPYGRALLVKLCVLAVPLLLGAYNRQRLVPAVVRRDEPAAWRHLRQTMTLEALFIALGVLVATAAMTSGGFY